VRKALQYLLGRQGDDGFLGPRDASKPMYNHAIASLALSEAYGITGSNLFREQAQRALDTLAAAQNSGAGWRYAARSGDSDTSVTGWALLAFKSAEISGLSFRAAVCQGGRAWLDETTDEFGRTGYTQRATGKVFLPGINERFEHHETLSAVAALSRILFDKNKADARLSQACELLLKDKPSWEEAKRDFNYWFWASQALHQFDGPSGPKWRSWNSDVKSVLVGNQEKDGSWEASDRWSSEGGRAYATAMNALTLETYYRYASVFGGR
jgi:hypothetical protein